MKNQSTDDKQLYYHLGHLLKVKGWTLSNTPCNSFCEDHLCITVWILHHTSGRDCAGRRRADSLETLAPPSQRYDVLLLLLSVCATDSSLTETDSSTCINMCAGTNENHINEKEWLFSFTLHDWTSCTHAMQAHTQLVLHHTLLHSIKK